MAPPALLVKLGQLYAFGEPDREVVVHSSALLKLSNPNIAAANPLPFAPAAKSAQAFRQMAGLPVVHAAVGEGDEPDVLPVAWGGAEPLQVAASPNGTTQATYSPSLGFLEAEGNVDVVVSTCFRWDKPSWRLRRRKRPAARGASGRQRRLRWLM